MLVRLTTDIGDLQKGAVCRIQPFFGNTYVIEQVVFGAQEMPDWYQCILRAEDFEVLDDAE